MCYILSDQ
ncbi:unnamed protein product, partial [Onchocerca ochengi]|uniref:Uncharacterized protein n=1 Tax=Onchocerca ochengi TaxID=42157 RepID=A0A182ELQ4_ONCOC